MFKAPLQIKERIQNSTEREQKHEHVLDGATKTSTIGIQDFPFPSRIPIPTGMAMRSAV